jgi:hypothetical protein
MNSSLICARNTRETNYRNQWSREKFSKQTKITTNCCRKSKRKGKKNYKRAILFFLFVFLFLFSLNVNTQTFIIFSMHTSKFFIQHDTICYHDFPICIDAIFFFTFSQTHFSYFIELFLSINLFSLRRCF